MEHIRSLGPRYDELNAAHADIVRTAVGDRGGQIVRSEGDAFFVVFTETIGATLAAVDIQRALLAHDWPDGHALRVRIGLHAGRAHRAGDDYGGPDVSRVARVVALASGGQILVTDAVRSLLEPDLPSDWSLRPLGRHRLKGVLEPQRLFQLDAPGLPHEFPALAAAVGGDHLPLRLTSLVGREAELETLDLLLAQHRLLTLTGAGGTGKTSLALELVHRAAGRFKDGARFVDLQAVRDPGAVMAETAREVGLFDGPLGSGAERLPGYLSQRGMLLVLDNFEHVIDAADGVLGLLRASPTSRLIVTSRIPLHLSMEQEYPVRPLALDATEDGDSAAVRLFVERALRVRPELSLDQEGQKAVTRICRLVDGLPLAIELCAARAATLPVTVIHDRLAKQLPLPGRGPRDLPARQQTLEATVDWSLQLLDPPLRTLFTRLGIFEESFELEQAETVCAPLDRPADDVLEGLTTLADQGLLYSVEDPLGGLRFRMLEPVRTIALGGLGEAGEDARLRHLHASAFAELAERAAPHLPGAEQVFWLDRLETDAANLRAAMTHALATDDSHLALRLAASLWRFWLQSGRLAEGSEQVERALVLPGAERPTPNRLRALDALGGVRYWSGDMAGAVVVYEEELALAQQLDERPVEALAWFNLAFTRRFLGDVAGSQAARKQAARMYEAVGDLLGAARNRSSWYIDGFLGGGLDASFIPRIEEQIERLEHETDPWIRRDIHRARSLVAWLRHDPAAASWAVVQSVRTGLAYRELVDAALAAQFLTVTMGELGRPELAAAAHGAARSVLERMGIQTPASYIVLAGRDPLPALEEALGPDGFEAAVARGRSLSLSDFIELATQALPSPEPPAGPG